MFRLGKKNKSLKHDFGGFVVAGKKKIKENLYIGPMSVSWKELRINKNKKYIPHTNTYVTKYFICNI